MAFPAQPHTTYRLPTNMPPAKGVQKVLRIATDTGGAMFEGNGRKAYRLARAVADACPEGWSVFGGGPSVPSGVVFLSVYRDGDRPKLSGFPVRQ